MSRALRFALHALLLGLVFLAAVESVSGPDLVLAAGFGAAAAAALPLAKTRGGPSPWRRARAAPRLVWTEAREMVGGSFHMAMVVLGRRPWHRSGAVEVPLERLPEITDTGVAVIAVLFTAVPGTIFLALDRAGGRIWVHSIDASSPEAVRADLARLYDVQRAVVP